MANPDAEGYTADSPLGVWAILNFWDDYLSKMTAPPINFLIDQKYNSDHANDPNFTEENDPRFHGLKFFLKRSMEINYQKQVTGGNLEYLVAKAKARIAAGLRNSVLDPVTDDQAVRDVTLFLNPVGEYSGQLASRGPGGFVRDNNGDTLRLKFVAHANYLKATLSLDLLGQLGDPLSVFSGGGPSFTVTFDTVTKIDVQLPHRSSERFQVQATTETTGAQVHAENADAALVPDALTARIAAAVNGWQTDISAVLRAQVQSLSTSLTGQEFDQADYSIDDSLLQAKFTQHPYRIFGLSIDYVQDQFPGRVENHAKALIGLPGTPVEVDLGLYPTGLQYIPVQRRYSDGTRYIIIEVQLWRQFINNVVGGRLVNLGGVYYIFYDDGTRLDLPRDFNPEDKILLGGLIPKRNPTPPGKAGLVRTIYLFVDYALETITGRYPDSSVFKVKAGQQIRIRGGETIPEIWFRVLMSGTSHRESVPPNAEPSTPPGLPYTAIYVGGG